jgi:hypothetical protein
MRPVRGRARRHIGDRFGRCAALILGDRLDIAIADLSEFTRRNLRFSLPFGSALVTADEALQHSVSRWGSGGCINRM